MRLRTTQFDLIVSLGGNCSAAGQLRHRGLRRFSLPLDWTLMTDDKPIRALPKLLATEFVGFLEYENAYAYSAPIVEKGQLTHHIQDRFSGFKFIHHFRGQKFDQSLFNPVRKVINRRLSRFFARVRASKRVLFVLETAFPFEIHLADDVYNALERTFPVQEIHLVVMQFGAKETTTRRDRDDKYIVCTYQRDLNIVYDNQFTAPEWSWMDDLELTAYPRPEVLRKKNLLIKWAFKIWWTLGKWLEERGAGVGNMRFRKFKAYTFEEARAQRT